MLNNKSPWRQSLIHFEAPPFSRNNSEYQDKILRQLGVLIHENHHLKTDFENNQKLLDECKNWLYKLNYPNRIQNVTRLIERLKSQDNVIK